MIIELTNVGLAVNSIGSLIDENEDNLEGLECVRGIGYNLEVLGERIEKIVTDLDENYNIVSKKSPDAGG